MAYQSRYIAYAKAYEKTPEEMVSMSREQRKVLNIDMFVVWISQQWRTWKELTKHSNLILTDKDHEAFDSWLNK